MRPTTFTITLLLLAGLALGARFFHGAEGVQQPLANVAMVSP